MLEHAPVNRATRVGAFGVPDAPPNGGAQAPEVSVVIPTLRRPDLVLRALASVFAQTFQNLEVIVVVDGPDEETECRLRRIEDPRFQYIVNPRSLTAAGARNEGVRHARGTWVAFLDDDDTWWPEKLARQLDVARAHPSALVTCRSRILRPDSISVWPEQLYDNLIPFDEYLFDRRTAFAGAAFIQTSSLLVPVELYRGCPFCLNSPHDDWDFVLRATKVFWTPVLSLPDVLVDVHEHAVSLSTKNNWRASLRWVDGVRAILTPRSYSGICLGIVGPRAARERAYEAVPVLLFKAFRHGSPRLAHVAAFFAFWTIPQGLRRTARQASSFFKMRTRKL